MGATATKTAAKITRKDSHQERHRDSRQEKRQARCWRLTAPTTRAVIAAVPSIGGVVAGGRAWLTPAVSAWRGGRSVRGAPAGFQFLGQNRRWPPQPRKRRPRGSRRIRRGLRNGRHRAPYRRHGIRRDLKLVGIGELRLPDPTATVATKLPGPASGRPQACHCDAIGCSAVWTDDQHWRIGKARKARLGTLTAVC
jgi:hypothetical protein